VHLSGNAANDAGVVDMQETLIVWSEGDNCDYALSFQEKKGCDEVWEKICQVLYFFTLSLFTEHTAFPLIILPTVILIIIGIPSPSHSFIPGLKPSFSAYPSQKPFFFFFRIHYVDSPDCYCYFLAYSVFYCLVFLFLHCLVVVSVQ